MNILQQVLYFGPVKELFYFSEHAQRRFVTRFPKKTLEIIWGNPEILTKPFPEMLIDIMDKVYEYLLLSRPVEIKRKTPNQICTIFDHIWFIVDTKSNTLLTVYPNQSLSPDFFEIDTMVRSFMRSNMHIIKQTPVIRQLIDHVNSFQLAAIEFQLFDEKFQDILVKAFSQKLKENLKEFKFIQTLNQLDA